MESIGGTAVVAGGSIAGLAAALALAPRMSRVVVLERHRLPERGEVATIVPQGTFPHVLLAGGAAALDRLAPGFTSALMGAGAVGGPGPRPCLWWAAGAVRRVIPDVGVDAPMCSRELVESTLRDALRAWPGMRFAPETAVRGLRLADGRVVGVEATGPAGPSSIDTDLFVDATGRAARSVPWLVEQGVSEPATEQVRVGGHVHIRRGGARGRRPGRRSVRGGAEQPRMPADRGRPADRDRHLAGRPGWLLRRCGSSRPGGIPRLRGVASRSVHPRPGDEAVGGTAPAALLPSQRRNWAAVSLPSGFCALGDAVASFNPVYGQGMSSAALQAEALAECLDRYGNSSALPRLVARRTAKVAGDPWRIATGGDFIYARTAGAKPRGTDAVNGYLERVMRVAAQDSAVNLALSRVQLLMAPPQSLMTPSVLARVLGRGVRRDVRATGPSPANSRVGRRRPVRPL